jgi:hypothetical protein
MKRRSYVYGWLMGAVVVASLAALVSSPVAAAPRRGCAHHHRGRCVKGGKHSRRKRSYRATLRLTSHEDSSSQGTATVRFQTLGAARVAVKGPFHDKVVTVKYRFKSVTLADMQWTCATFTTDSPTGLVISHKALPRTTLSINRVEKVSWVAAHWKPERVSPAVEGGPFSYKDPLWALGAPDGSTLRVEGGVWNGRLLSVSVYEGTFPDERTSCSIAASAELQYRLPL